MLAQRGNLYGRPESTPIEQPITPRPTSMNNDLSCLKQEWQFTCIPSFSLVNLSSKIRNIYQGQGHRLVIGSCDDYMDYVVKRYCIHELSV
jgi:hypothetical protein